MLLFPTLKAFTSLCFMLYSLVADHSPGSQFARMLTIFLGGPYSNSGSLGGTLRAKLYPS